MILIGDRTQLQQDYKKRKFNSMDFNVHLLESVRRAVVISGLHPISHIKLFCISPCSLIRSIYCILTILHLPSKTTFTGVTNHVVLLVVVLHCDETFKIFKHLPNQVCQ